MEECKPLVGGAGALGAVPGGLGVQHGEAVQIDPIKHTLKAPGLSVLILKYDEPLSNFAFNFNLRLYNTAGEKVRALANPRITLLAGPPPFIYLSRVNYPTTR